MVGYHSAIAFVVALPGLVFYLGVIPVAVTVYLWRRRDNLTDRKVVFRVGLLFSGYRQEKWWWEIVTVSYLQQTTVALYGLCDLQSTCPHYL